MPLTTVPDVERVVSDYLRTHADVVALGARVVGKTPEKNKNIDNQVLPWVRVTELDAPQVNQPDHLVESMLQFDCYAGATGGQPEANTLARTVRAVLGTLPNAGVRVLGGPRQVDTLLEPARDYKILTAIVWVHS